MKNEKDENKAVVHAEEVNAPAAEEKKAPPADHPDEEHAHGNYMFALKVLCILLAIILIIVILKASGVPIAIKDWLAHVSAYIPPLPLYAPR